MTAHPVDIPLPPELPTLDSDPVPPRGAEPESEIIGPIAGRYDLGERIAKGGMGIVFRAQDRVLNRTVALKIIRSRFLERPDLLRRFIAEARISGRLQHPGVVPVYEVGTLPDARPFIAMKLIEGRTLARLLRDRNDSGDNLAFILKVFEDVCQAVAYAHQQGVIHRDLKPDNVLVGEFGEVQVMDWGLAKFLDPDAALAPAPDGFEAVERSVYLSGDGTTPAGEGQTQVTAVYAVGPDFVDTGYTTAGEVFGTLPYMPPEQARGEADRVDRRGDVFALGAILCQILTGQPPYFGPPESLREQAREGKLFGAYVLLDRCGADPALIGLAKKCLVAEPDGRPADAGVLAALVTECLDGLQNQTRQIEVKRLTAEARLAEAEAKARLARRARRLSRALAVVGVLVAGLFASGLGWYANDRAARTADDTRRRTIAVEQIEAALAEAEELTKQARDSTTPPAARDAAGRQAVSACQRAESLLVAAPNLPGDVNERFTELQARVSETERDNRLMMALEEWRTNLFDAQGRADPSKDKLWTQILAHRGLTIPDGPPRAMSDELFGRPIGRELSSAVMAWFAVTTDPAERRRLTTLVDSGGLWARAISQGTPDDLAQLADDENLYVPAAWVVVAARELITADRLVPAEKLLCRGVRRYQADFTLNAMYGTLLRQKPDAQADAVRYLTVAKTARPDDPLVQCELGLALAEVARAEEAVETLQAALQADPKWVAGHMKLGELLENRGETDPARASFLKAIALDEKCVQAQLGLARTELARGDLTAAEQAFRVATSDGQHKALAHAGLGRIHLKRWEASRATAEFQSAVDAEPANVDYRLGLVEARRISNDRAGGISEARAATRAIPRSASFTRHSATCRGLPGTNWAPWPPTAPRPGASRRTRTSTSGSPPLTRTWTPPPGPRTPTRPRRSCGPPTRRYSLRSQAPGGRSATTPRPARPIVA